MAWILKYAVNEFVDEPVEKIMGLIEGEPVIAAVPIYSSQSNILSKIIGVNTEDKVPNEGVVTYDIKFVVYTPSGERTKLIINIEAQKEFYTNFDIIEVIILSVPVMEYEEARLITSEWDNGTGSK